MKPQIIRLAILLVVAVILMLVNVKMSRPASLWAPVARMAAGTVVCVTFAKFTGLWR